MPETSIKSGSTKRWSILWVVLLGGLALTLHLLQFYAMVPTHWIPLGEDERGNRYALDTLNIVRSSSSPDTIDYWLQVDISDQQYQLNGKPVHSVIEHHRTQCTAKSKSFTSRAIKRMYVSNSVGVIRMEQPPRVELLKPSLTIDQALVQRLCPH